MRVGEIWEKNNLYNTFEESFIGESRRVKIKDIHPKYISYYPIEDEAVAFKDDTYSGCLTRENFIRLYKKVY